MRQEHLTENATSSELKADLNNFFSTNGFTRPKSMVQRSIIVRRVKRSIPRDGPIGLCLVSISDQRSWHVTS